MKIQALGHAVIKVRNVQRAEDFYNGILGLPIAARMESPMGPMTFFTLGNHHDFAVLGMGDDAPAPPRNAPGLFHVAFKVGDTLDELREVKTHLEAAGVRIDATIDHTVTDSLYLRDPDGNGIELYVDVSDVWKSDPQSVASGVALAL
ncbi:MAG: VOC family protein [Tepidiformaceae bacterium]